jgi:uncharacterized membrane protein HdeD (DUF308 family)
MSAATETSSAGGRRAAAGLRTLYFVRFGFAIVWAALLVVTGGSLSGVSVALLVLYPLVDAAAAVIDFRVSRGARPAAVLWIDTALGVLAAIALGVAAASGAAAALAVWGVWAIVAGLAQFIAAVIRRRLGGQWPLIVSGAISVIAGTAFVVQASAGSTALVGLAGYATLGGIFFLVAAIRLATRPASQ